MKFLAILLAITVCAAHPNKYVKRYDLGDKPLYNPGLIEGDIAGYSKYGKNASRNAIISEYEIWPGGIVPYTLDWSVDTIHDELMEGMKEYHDKTCVKFVPKEAHHKDWIDIAWYQGCWSLVGRNGGEQTVSIGSGCHWKGLVVHELGHAIGFHHEHQRSDRDDYLTIHFENIMEGLEYNFEKLRPFENNFLDEPYDLTSVMQYESEAFSKDGVSPVITPKDSSVKLIPVWKKDGLSEIDVRRVKKLYQCDGMVRPTPSPIPPMLCDFESEDICGFTNDFEESKFERVQNGLAGHTGWYMEVDAQKAKSVGARLNSPTMMTYRKTKACVSIKYYVHGEGIHDFTVSMQHHDYGNIIQTGPKDDKWYEFKQEFPLQETEGHIRFFITAVFNQGKPGKVAIDDAYINFDGCP